MLLKLENPAWPSPSHVAAHTGALRAQLNSTEQEMWGNSSTEKDMGIMGILFAGITYLEGLLLEEFVNDCDSWPWFVVKTGEPTNLSEWNERNISSSHQQIYGDSWCINNMGRLMNTLTSDWSTRFLQTQSGGRPPICGRQILRDSAPFKKASSGEAWYVCSSLFSRKIRESDTMGLMGLMRTLKCTSILTQNMGVHINGSYPQKLEWFISPKKFQVLNQWWKFLAEFEVWPIQPVTPKH